MKRFLSLLIFLFISDFSLADSPVIVFSDTTKLVVVGKNIQILEDKTNSLTIQQIFSSTDFRLSTSQNPNLGISTSTFWIKFVLQNNSNYKELLLTLSDPLIDEVLFYKHLPNGKFALQKIQKSWLFSQRKYKHQNYIFDIYISKNETDTFFIKVKSDKPIQLPLTIGTLQSTFESMNNIDLLSGLYFGVILIIFFYNLFLYFTVRDKNYLYYIIYILFIGLTQACLHEYAYRYLWPNSPWLATHSIFIIPSLTGIATILFSNNFLQTKRFTPTSHKLSIIIITIYCIGIILGVGVDKNLSYNIIDFTALLLSIYLLYVAIKIVIKGYRPAIFFLVAWVSFLVCVVVFVMSSKDVIPSNNITNHILQIGSAIEVTLLSFALADRINTLKKEKEISQAQVLLASQENERMILNQNVILESKVRERTSELEASNTNLRETQSQLVNSEKMASLGQLTAGVAHEINNPINFVISNIKPLKRDIADIFSLLTKYDEIKDPENLNERLKEINEFKEKHETDYLLTEINLLLKGIDEGAIRTAEIVKGLKIFAHLDEKDFKKTNIIEGIDSTLLLLNNSIHHGRVKVIKEYANPFPEIDCIGGQINQVFMNILNNAIQAMADSKNSKPENILSIKIDTEGTNAIIKIKDNGSGIPDSIVNKIFDPFFTTKSVGSGTGLGLSIVYKIINEHKGDITVKSEEGKGTEFIISLPIFNKPRQNT